MDTPTRSPADRQSRAIPTSTEASRWPGAVVFIHWTTVLIVVSVFALVLSREFIEDKTVRQWLLHGHWYAGMTAWLLLFVRIPVRLGADVPRHGLPRLQKVLSAAGHGLLYLGLLLLPAMGYALACARYGHVDFAGIALPTLIERDRDLAETLEAFHGWAGWAMLALIGLHALAALMHHHVFKDDVLRAMLPARRRR